LHCGFIAAAPAATLEELEAVFLYNFSSFITWPESHFDQTKGIFNICLLGENEHLLQALTATVETEVKTESGHPLAIVELDSSLAQKLIKNDKIALKEVDICHILFIPIETQDNVDIKTLLNSLFKKPILTVSNMEDFANDCGMVQFKVSKGSRISLQMQYPRIESSQLQVASALLELVVLNEDGHCGVL